MKTKSISLTIFLFIGLNFFSCTGECDFAPAPDFFDIQDLSIFHRDMNSAPITEASINFDDYGHIECRFLVDYIVSQLETRSLFLPLNVVYGCSPEEPGAEGSKNESLIDLQIITINEFDDDHPAGSSINDIIVIDDFNLEPMFVSDYLDAVTGNIPYVYFQLRLTERPASDQAFQIGVILELSTEEVFEVETEPITFL